MANSKEYVPTVSVIVIKEGSVEALTSFRDTPAGNKEAEKLFRKVCKDHGLKSPGKILDAIDDGYFEGMNFGLNLVHSFEN